MLTKIDQLRRALYFAIEADLDYEIILAASRNLDVCIANYMKTEEYMKIIKNGSYDINIHKEARIDETLNNIITAAQNIKDPADFGINVANLLFESNLIDEFNYLILSGQL